MSIKLIFVILAALNAVSGAWQIHLGNFATAAFNFGALIFILIIFLARTIEDK